MENEPRDPRVDPKPRRKMRCPNSPTGWAFLDHFCWNHFKCTCEPCPPPTKKDEAIHHAK